MKGKENIRIGIVGAGRIGRIHAENLASRIVCAEAAVISDTLIAAAEAAGRDFGIPNAVADHRKILDDASIEAVVVCSPTGTHAALISEAAAAGKQIFCEKPVDLDLETARGAVAAAESAGVKLQIGFNRRFDPDFARVRELVADGAVGKVHIVKITSRDPEPPGLEYLKVSGGLFLDMMVHDFDMARFLAGEEVVEVFAAGGALVDSRIESVGDIDTAAVTLRLASGAIALIDNSRKAVYGYDQRVEVFGTKGCASAGNKSPEDAVLWDASGRRQGNIHHFFLQRYAASYLAEMNDFIDCVRSKRAPRVSGADGLAALALGLAAKKSLKEARPVRVEEVASWKRQKLAHAEN